MEAAPLRTCVGCRTVAPKATLVRFVRVRAGALDVDPTGSAPGRGAYVHPDEGCMERAIGRGLARALKADVGPDGAGRLRKSIEGVLRNA
jgi:predicted RNA-binding protein YlxR (DUF448 family)